MKNSIKIAFLLVFAVVMASCGDKPRTAKKDRSVVALPKSWSSPKTMNNGTVASAIRFAISSWTTNMDCRSLSRTMSWLTLI